MQVCMYTLFESNVVVCELSVLGMFLFSYRDACDSVAIMCMYACMCTPVCS